MAAGAPLEPLAPFRLDGRVAVVTGASSGLGARFARVLRAAGARVVVTARRRDRLEGLVAELGDDALAVPCDLGRVEELDRPVAAGLEHFGRVDVLVNNAGVSHVGPAEDEPTETFVGVMNLNLVAPFVLAQHVARAAFARDEPAVVVNVASMLGTVGIGRIPQASYAASKGGLINLTRELSAQWSRRGVRVNALAPGWFASEMTTDLFADERGQRFIARGAPLGRGGLEHELDGALLFLAGDASSYVTGQVVTVDGGWTSV